MKNTFNIKEIAHGDNTEMVINYIRSNTSIDLKTKEALLKPFNQFSTDVKNGDNPNAVKIGILNAFYSGVRIALGL